MSSKRQLQVNSLLQRELALYWEREVEMPQGSILSVARVEVVPSFDTAFIYIAVWPEDRQEVVMNMLKKDIYATQKYIDKKLAMKKVPKLVLRFDQQSISRREVEDVLDSLED